MPILSSSYYLKKLLNNVSVINIFSYMACHDPLVQPVIIYIFKFAFSSLSALLWICCPIVYNNINFLIAIHLRINNLSMRGRNKAHCSISVFIQFQMKIWKLSCNPIIKWNSFAGVNCLPTMHHPSWCWRIDLL